MLIRHTQPTAHHLPTLFRFQTAVLVSTPTSLGCLSHEVTDNPGVACLHCGGHREQFHMFAHGHDLHLQHDLVERSGIDLYHNELQNS